MIQYVFGFGYLVFGRRDYHAYAPTFRNAVQSKDQEEEKYEVVLASMG